MCSDAGPAPTPDPLIGQSAKAMSELASRQEDRVAAESAANEARLTRLEPLLAELYREQSGMARTNTGIAAANQSRVESMGWPIERTLAADAVGYYDADADRAAQIESLMRGDALRTYDYDGKRAALMAERDAYEASMSAHQAAVAAIPAIDREALRSELLPRYTKTTAGTPGRAANRGNPWAPGFDAAAVAGTEASELIDEAGLAGAIDTRVRAQKAAVAGVAPAPATRDFDAELAALEQEYAKYQGGVDSELAAMRLYKDSDLASREAAARDAGAAISSRFVGANRASRAEMARAGLSPDSGAYAGLISEREAMEASASASAMTAARTAAKSLGWSKRMDAAGLARGWSGNQATSTGLALNAGTTAVNTALTPGNVATQNQQTANAGTQVALGGYGAGGNLALGGYQGQVGAWSAAQQAAAAETAALGSAIGMAGAAAISPRHAAAIKA